MTNLHEMIHSKRDVIANAIGVPETTVRGWHDRQSIPQQYWPQIVDAKLATWDDLRVWAKPRANTILEANK